METFAVLERGPDLAGAMPAPAAPTLDAAKLMILLRRCT
jgi:hypothetical protein